MKSLYDMYIDSFRGLSRGVWILSLVMVINRAGAMVVPFMSLYLTKGLGYTMSQAGWVMAAFGVGSVGGAYLGGFMTDKIGFYKVQLFALIKGAGILFVLFFVTELWTITLLVFFFALLSDAVRPANTVAVAHFSELENRTRSYSLVRFAANVGFAVGPAMGGLVAGWFGFKWIFIIDALTCIGAAVVLYFYLPNVETKRIEEKKHVVKSTLSAYKDFKYLWFIFLVFLYAISFFQLFTSIPVYWDKTWSFSESTIGLLIALNGLVVFLIEMPLVKSVEHVQRSNYMIFLGCILLLMGYMALLLGFGLSSAILYVVLISVSEVFAMPFMTNFAISRSSEERRGQYMALYTMAYGSALTVAPFCSLRLAENLGFTWLFIIILGITLFTTFAFFRMRERDLDFSQT